MTSSPLPLPTGAPRGGEHPLPLSRGRIVDILTDSLTDLRALSLSLQGPDAEATDAARRLRDSLVSQIADHVLPRLADADVPAVVVVGGSTGAGKSTLVNSVLGREVTEAGVLRPTTRVPVLVTNPEDAQVLADHPVSQVCRTVVDDAVPPGLALVDASDLDSVQEANRALALRLLEAADLWLFITTAARYGDLTPWTTLERAAQRGTPVAVVLNRAPHEVLSEVRRDLVTRLAGLGLAEAPFFVIPDAGPHQGPLSGHAVEDLRQWLELLAGRHRAAGLTRRGERRLWDELTADLSTLAQAVEAQEQAAVRLEERTQALVTQAREELGELIAVGPAASGAVATRWVSLASTGGPLQDLSQGRALRRGWLGRRARAREEALAVLAQDADEAVTLVARGSLDRLRSELAQVWAEASAQPVPASVVQPGASHAGRGESATDWAGADQAGHGQTGTDLAGTDQTGADQAGHSGADAAGYGSADPAGQGRTGVEAIRSGEAGPGLAAGGRAASARALEDSASPQSAWHRHLVEAIADATPKGLTPGAAADLVAAAACGLDGAVRACERLGLADEVSRAKAELAARWQETAQAVLPQGSAAALAPSQTVAASLRLRAAELTPLTHLGRERTA